MNKKFDYMSFYTRRPVDRRRVKNKRFFPKQENLDHNPGRKINMIERRMFGDRRGLFPEIMDTFWKEAP
jgi:hypothetical protein